MTDDPAAPTPGNQQRKTKVFVSYSRRDMAFADRLEQALKTRGIDPLIDRSEIYAFEDWWQRIESLIVRSDTIVFVLSPDALSSDVCSKEVAFATSLNKRFAPIVLRPIDDKSIPEPLARLNFIFFDDEARFEESVNRLAEALATDIDWIRKHTEFGESARRWAAAGRPGPRGLLLGSPVLEEAEGWIASRPQGAPEPTEEAQALVAESRRAATRRQRTWVGGSLIAAATAAGLAGLAMWQRSIAVDNEQLAIRNEQEAKAAQKEAEVQRNTAVEQRDKTLVTDSLRLAALAGELSRVESHERALLVALDGLPDVRAGVARPYVPDVEARLYAAIHLLRVPTVLEGHDNALNSMSFSPDGSGLVTSSRDGTARVWDLRGGSQTAVLRGHENVVWSAEYDPSGQRIITASADGTARIWDAASARPSPVLRGHSHAVDRASFSPDGRTAITASRDGTARLWDSETAQLLGAFEGHTGAVLDAKFRNGGSNVVTCSEDATIRIWDVRTLAQLSVLRGHTGRIYKLSLSADGSRLLSASADGTARIWDAKSGTFINVLSGHRDAVLDAVFDPSGMKAVTASRDGTVRIWDAGGGKERAILFGQGQSVNHAAFSPDRSRIASGSDDGTA